MARLTPRSVTPATLGAWLLKGDPAHDEVVTLLRTGFADLATRCVRRSYRTDLVTAGQLAALRAGWPQV